MADFEPTKEQIAAGEAILEQLVQIARESTEADATVLAAFATAAAMVAMSADLPIEVCFAQLRLAMDNAYREAGREPPKCPTPLALRVAAQHLEGLLRFSHEHIGSHTFTLVAGDEDTFRGSVTVTRDRDTHEFLADLIELFGDEDARPVRKIARILQDAAQKRAHAASLRRPEA